MSVIEMMPLRVPIAVGLKVTVIVQLPPAFNLEPQLFTCEKSPLAVMLLIFKVAVPGLVSVTVCGVLVVPTSWLPKLRLLLDSVTA